jgi:hypothetical protein
MAKLVSLLTILVLLISGAAFAEDGFKVFLGYSVGGLNVKDTTYLEAFNFNYSYSNKYNSLTHGPNVTIQYEGSKVFLRGTFDYNWSESAKYRMITDGDAFVSGTNESGSSYIYKVEGNIGYRIFQQNEFNVTPYIGAGYLYENVSINNFGGAKKTDWPYGVAGGILCYSAPQWSIGLDLAALLPFSVRTKGVLFSTTFESNIGWGIRTQIPVTYTIIPKKENAFGLMLFATPFYEYSDSGKSKAIYTRTSPDDPPGLPGWKLKTTREHYGVKAGIGFVF